MGSSSSEKERRRAALIALQQLLSRAEDSLSRDDPEGDRVLKDLGTAFEDFRTKYHDRPDVPAPPTPAADGRWLAMRKIAAAIKKMDESTSRRDADAVRTALGGARQALDVLQRIDASASSGVRVRPEDADDVLPTKRRGQP
jgi:hypothetical protein